MDAHGGGLSYCINSFLVYFSFAYFLPFESPGAHDAAPELTLDLRTRVCIHASYHPNSCSSALNMSALSAPCFHHFVLFVTKKPIKSNTTFIARRKALEEVKIRYEAV